MRFNPPPNWPPPPPGWSPDPTWRPDPSWPEPPVGWPLWVPEQKRKGVIIAVAVVAVLAVVGGTIGIVVWMSRPSKGAAFAATIDCDVDNSEEQEVCDSIRDRFTALVDHDRSRMRELTCSRGVPLSDEGLDAEIAAFRVGDIRISITDIRINGDKARITVTQQLSTSRSQSFEGKFEWAKEDGTWKACSELLTE